jgi:DNA helicase-2/ATP-dependent DNA helicase PcrA
MIAPVRFYVTQQQGMGDRYVHGARSRFISERVMQRMQRVSAGERQEGYGVQQAAAGPRIDVANRLRDMW